MVQFHSATRTRDVNSFCFGDFRPNASATDLCGEKQCKKKLQQSIDRGFFYVFADKLGTVRSADGKMCTEGNYLPCWTTSEQKYQVLGKWPETLWKQRKISDEIYEELLFLTRDGVVSRQRNFQACQARQGKRVSQQAIEDRVKRIRSNPEIYKPFPEIPVVRQWLHLFTKDALRYPILIVLGASRAGKTEYAKSLFQRPLELKIGALEFFPDTMRQFRRGGAGCASAVDGRLCCAVLCCRRVPWQVFTMPWCLMTSVTSSSWSTTKRRFRGSMTVWWSLVRRQEGHAPTMSTYLESQS